MRATSCSSLSSVVRQPSGAPSTANRKASSKTSYTWRTVIRVPAPSASKVTVVWAVNFVESPTTTPLVNTSRSGGEISRYLPLDQKSCPSGERMQMAQTPPGRKSISASGTV